MEFDRHRKVLDSVRLDETEKERYRLLLEGRAEKEIVYTSLKFLTECPYKATGRRTIILIDEYDVPLGNAYFRGFYREMVDCIRSLLESALKTNECVEFSVITGCFRNSKETIFTGLNHLEINTILSNNYSEYFGFLPEEVRAMLSVMDQNGDALWNFLFFTGYLTKTAE